MGRLAGYVKTRRSVSVNRVAYGTCLCSSKSISFPNTLTNYHSGNEILFIATGRRIVNTIQNNMDLKHFTCRVFIDLRRTSDTVDHSVLLQKLNHCGISRTINNWFSPYLLDQVARIFQRWGGGGGGLKKSPVHGRLRLIYST